LGFGGQTQPVQPSVNNLLGGDFIGFGAPTTTAPPVPNPGFGFNTQPVQSPPTQNYGLNLLGGTVGTNQPPSVQPQISLGGPVSSGVVGFQPIANNNPNKILAYDNQHIQIWMDCQK
jgi:hypothetical protein